MQLRVRHIARNVLFNWAGTLANMAVGFFFAPFILHRLGDVAYGVWVLAVSMVGYLGLLDLGMQSSVLRFVSKGYTQGDHEGSSDAISAALWVRVQISALVLVLSGVLALGFARFFKVPPALASDARWAILLIGLTAAMGMSVGVVGGVLSALNRYDLQNYVSLTQTAVRVVGVVAVLRSGHGIVAIAACELLAAAVANLLLVRIASYLYPQLRVRFRKPKRETLRMIWSYSAYAFLTTIAVQLVYQTDNLVVGAFVSASAVTYYAIANSLCRYSGQIVGSIAGTFVPAASTYEAAGDTAGLLRLFRTGTRATILISVPVLVTFLVRGHSFIGLWMGPQYALKSGNVLILLAAPLFFAYANRTAGSIAYGVGKHREMSLWAIGEGVANLVLSVILVRYYGIYGVAIGTLIPNLFAQLYFWPRYISKLVGLSSFEVIWRIWMPVFATAIPFAMASYAVERLVPAHSLIMFFLQVVATLPVFLLMVGLVFHGYVRTQLVPRVQSLLSNTAF